MITLAQDNVNDIFLENHDLKVVSDVSAYAVILADAVRTVEGELQLDIERGIDYFGSIFESVNRIPNWRANVRDIILGYPFVESIESIDVEFSPNDKNLSYKIVVITDKGETVVS